MGFQKFCDFSKNINNGEFDANEEEKKMYLKIEQLKKINKMKMKCRNGERKSEKNYRSCERKNAKNKGGYYQDKYFIKHKVQLKVKKNQSFTINANMTP